MQRLELGLAKAHLVIRETIQTDNQPPLADKDNVLVGPVYWNAYAFQRNIDYLHGCEIQHAHKMRCREGSYSYRYHHKKSENF